jgi:hypothetical protein
MAGVVPIDPSQSGSMTGKLEIQTDKFIAFAELCTHLPQVKAFVSALEHRGCYYL